MYEYPHLISKLMSKDEDTFSQEYNADREHYFNSVSAILEEALSRIGEVTRRRVHRWGHENVSDYLLPTVNKIICKHCEVGFDDVFPGTENADE